MCLLGARRRGKCGETMFMPLPHLFGQNLQYVDFFSMETNKNSVKKSKLGRQIFFFIFYFFCLSVLEVNPPHFALSLGLLLPTFRSSSKAFFPLSGPHLEPIPSYFPSTSKLHLRTFHTPRYS